VGRDTVSAPGPSPLGPVARPSPGWAGQVLPRPPCRLDRTPLVGQPGVVTTPALTQDQFRPVVDELRAIRKSLHRIYVLLMIPTVPFMAFVAGTVLRFFFPE
jgi:hypothetical protein